MEPPLVTRVCLGSCKGVGNIRESAIGYADTRDLRYEVLLAAADITRFPINVLAVR